MCVARSVCKWDLTFGAVNMTASLCTKPVGMLNTPSIYFSRVPLS